MTQIPVSVPAPAAESNAAPATAAPTADPSSYLSLLAKTGAMAEPELWALMEAAVRSLRQQDTLARSIEECGAIELFGSKYPGDFDFLPTQSEALMLVEAIADRFSNGRLHKCWRSLLAESSRIQKLALIEAITYAQHYSCTVRQALHECQLDGVFSESLEYLQVWLSEPEALRLIRSLSGSLLASDSETLPNAGDGRDDR